jgi:hypothetical protein
MADKLAAWSRLGQPLRDYFAGSGGGIMDGRFLQVVSAHLCHDPACCVLGTKKPPEVVRRLLAKSLIS